MHTIVSALVRTTQVKVTRRRVLQHDLDLFAAISGHRPSVAPDLQPVQRAISVRTAASARSWSSSVLAAYLGNLRKSRLAVRAVRPELADWMRDVSQRALDRLAEAHARLASARDGASRRRRAA